jgi:hypothetical protein
MVLLNRININYFCFSFLYVLMFTASSVSWNGKIIYNDELLGIWKERFISSFIEMCII